MNVEIRKVEASDAKFKDIDRIKVQVNAELTSLKTELAEKDTTKNLFLKEGENEFDVDLAIQYLTMIKDKEWSKLKTENPGAWIMAVQIILESKGYNVGKIDGILWDATKRVVREFQTKEMPPEEVDGWPGNLTMNKLLWGEVIGNQNGVVEISADQELIKKFALVLDSPEINLYTRQGYAGKYLFSKWILYYLWDDKALPQYYDSREDKRMNNEESTKQAVLELKSKVISDLGLQAKEWWIYSRNWYKGEYLFDDRWTLHYSGSDGALPQYYNYSTKNRSIEKNTQAILTKYNLKLTQWWFYVNDREWIYGFDSKGTLFYRSDSEWIQKLENGQWIRPTYSELPDLLKTRSATIKLLWLKKNKGWHYTRKGFSGTYIFNEWWQLTFHSKDTSPQIYKEGTREIA